MEGDWESELERWYEAERNGDNILTHFQCDICHFRNMNSRSLEKSNLKDNTLFEIIWRVSLDAFWIRDPGTIK